MSGGFFRGTSADQDTRFSNKQAKLMKSQKFAPELEHLVEMTKVKMDVIKPWIATRVTELLGFEDEVLINFIYGLLDRKNVNGKEVQIQLTGFMEKNTGKFMKELWILLLSAQKNASGIPQQFLDAKEEETRKKKAEADRITHEILKKKEREGRELEQDKLKKMDVEVANAVSEPISKHSLPRASSIHREEEKEADERNGSERKNRISRSPLSADRSSSPQRSTRSRSRSKSLSNSRSYSGERHRSRGISGSPQPRGHSSPDSLHRSPRNRSISPDLRYSPRRPRSPFRRRSPHSRHRSSSYSRHRSPSPLRRRSPSPVRRRSPSPVRRRLPSPSRRRSPSPYRRRLPSSYRRRSPSPYRRRSPSPVRRRSPPPMRRRSPSPLRRRSPSPMRRRSPIPVRRRSPTSYRRRSPSPLRRSPPPPPRGSPSPVRRSPFIKSPRRQRRSPVRSPRQRKWSRSPYRSQSPAYQNRRSLSRDHDIVTNGAESSRHRDTYAPQRTHRIISPVLHASEREEIEHSGEGDKQPGSLSRRPPISLRSPQRDPRDQSDTRENRIVQSPSPGKSPSPSDSSPRAQRMIPSKNRRSSSPSESPVRQRRERITRDDSRSPVRQVREKTTRHDNPETSRVDEELSHSREKGGYRIHSSKAMRPSPVGSSKRSPTVNLRRDGYPPESDRSTGPLGGRPHNIELRKKDQERRSEKASMRKDPPERLAQPTSHSSEKIEYGPGVTKGRKLSLDHFHDEQPSTRQLERDSPSTERLHKSYLKESDKPHEKKRSHSIKFEEGDQVHKKGAVQRSMKKDDQNEHNRASDSESEENKIYKLQGAAKKKSKRLDRHGSVSDDDAGFEIDERKDAKRRRKEEKKLRKEERRRRREERHRKKEERRASKLKTKSMDTVTPPSDFEKNRDVVDSDSDVAVRRKPHPSDTEEAESEQKKLEIELRKKALESLRAKKGIGS